jgi:hypothetical protein
VTIGKASVDRAPRRAGAIGYTRAEKQAALARIELVSHLMDSAFTLPGTNTRVGLDALIGLVPVLGDLISQAISSYIIWEARQLGVSRWTMTRMIANSAVDTVVGFVPFLGDAFDVAFRANLRNLALLKQHLAREGIHSSDGVIDGDFRRIDP